MLRLARGVAATIGDDASGVEERPLGCDGV
jgi:hypothetical protein